MAIYNSYVKLPEGIISYHITPRKLPSLFATCAGTYPSIDPSETVFTIIYHDLL